MWLLNFLRGYLELTVSGGYPQDFLNRLAAQGVTFWRPAFQGDFYVTLRLYPHSLKAARRAAERTGCTLDVVRRRGFRAVFYGLGRRWVLLAGLALALTLALALQGRIWTVSVEGCETYRPQQVLQALEELGVGFGTRSRGLDAQVLETRMKLLLPELGFFTLNVSGCRAQAVVRERTDQPELVDERAVCNVVAARTGVVQELRVYAGKSLTVLGQTVVRGQLLVTGAVDHSRCVQYTHAQADVLARTWRDMTAAAPLSTLEKGEAQQTRVTWSLVVGKKRFIFGQNGGISSGLYDKMTETMYLTLPGGVTLPFLLVRETVTVYRPAEQALDPAQVQARLEARLREAVLADMIGGTLQAARFDAAPAGSFLRVAALCQCTEQIGLEQPIDVIWIESDTNDD